MEKQLYLKRQRAQREAELIGKYVIVQNSRYQKDQLMYLQDESIASSHGHKGMHWTLYKANAKGFDNKYVAMSIARQFKYNNVRVMEVK